MLQLGPGLSSSCAQLLPGPLPPYWGLFMNSKGPRILCLADQPTAFMRSLTRATRPQDLEADPSQPTEIGFQ